MNDKMLVETAVLAGEIMLTSGAEIYRVEDTIRRMLEMAEMDKVEAIVFSTGIFVSLGRLDGETITVVKRVKARSSNLNRVYLVNDVSRSYCSGQLTVEEAYAKLKEIQNKLQYRDWMKILGTIGVAAFFALLLGAGPVEWLAAAATGAILALVSRKLEKAGLNNFCVNVGCAFSVAVTALILEMVIPEMNADTVITSAIMPLVPGVIFTTAIRDMLNGDYLSGSARIVEAVVIALAVAAGVGAGMAGIQWFLGGGRI